MVGYCLVMSVFQHAVFHLLHQMESEAYIVLDSIAVETNATTFIVLNRYRLDVPYINNGQPFFSCQEPVRVVCQGHTPPVGRTEASMFVFLSTFSAPSFLSPSSSPSERPLVKQIYCSWLDLIQSLAKRFWNCAWGVYDVISLITRSYHKWLESGYLKETRFSLGVLWLDKAISYCYFSSYSLGASGKIWTLIFRICSVEVEV